MAMDIRVSHLKFVVCSPAPPPPRLTVSDGPFPDSQARDYMDFPLVSLPTHVYTFSRFSPRVTDEPPLSLAEC